MSNSSVLTEVLNLLCSRGVVTIIEVTKKIGIPRNTVMQVIHALLAEGVIVKANTRNVCSGCPLKDFCNSPHSYLTEVYVLTVKGLMICSRRNGATG